MSSRSEKPPEEPVFCIDEALGGIVVVSSLRAAGHRVERLIDHHSPGTEDVIWLPDVGRRGWVVLTKDKRMRHRPAEVLSIVKHGVRAFALTGGNMRATEMATAFLTAMPRMKQFLARHPRPFVAAVTKAGQVSLVYPKSVLRQPG